MLSQTSHENATSGVFSDLQVLVNVSNVLPCSTLRIREEVSDFLIVDLGVTDADGDCLVEL